MTVHVAVVLGEAFPQDVEVFRTRAEAQAYVIKTANHLCATNSDRVSDYDDALTMLYNTWHEHATIYERDVDGD